MPASSGRLTSRPGPPADAPLPPGLHRLAAAPDTLVAVPRAPAAVPLLVLLHGAGGDSGSLAAVRDAACGRGVLVVVPSSAGPTWDLLTGRLGPDVAALDAALAEVFARHEVPRVALAGFSDGGSYALSLGLANGDLAEAVVAFSPGFLAPPAQVGQPRVWVSHGTRDQVLPVERCGRRVRDTLRTAGYDVTYEEFDGPHVAPPALVEQALDWWLQP